LFTPDVVLGELRRLARHCPQGLTRFSHRQPNGTKAKAKAETKGKGKAAKIKERAAARARARARTRSG